MFLARRCKCVDLTQFSKCVDLTQFIYETLPICFLKCNRTRGYLELRIHEFHTYYRQKPARLSRHRNHSDHHSGSWKKTQSGCFQGSETNQH